MSSLVLVMLVGFFGLVMIVNVVMIADGCERLRFGPSERDTVDLHALGAGSADPPKDDGPATGALPDGRTIERDSTMGGITPDITVRDTSTVSGAVERRLPLSADPVIQRAHQLLQGVTTPAALRARLPSRGR